MASLSQMFPIVTRAVSLVRSVFAKSVDSENAEITAPEAGAQVILTEMPDGLQRDLAELAEDTAAADMTTPGFSILETLPEEEIELGLEHSPSSDDAFSILGLYEAWVELEERVKQAQDELQAILATREEAAILRRKAQEVLKEGEAIRAEA